MFKNSWIDKILILTARAGKQRKRYSMTTTRPTPMSERRHTKPIQPQTKQQCWSAKSIMNTATRVLMCGRSIKSDIFTMNW